MAIVKVVTPPEEEPVSVAEMKLHLRIDGDAEDEVLAEYITAAREHAEHVTGRRLVTQTLEVSLPCFRHEMFLPASPVQSIEAITYRNMQGEVVTLSADDYQLYANLEPAKVSPVYGKSWPAILHDQPDSAVIRFVAGYGDATEVPRSLVQAIKMLAAHWYEHREAVYMNGTANDMPMATKHLLALYRTYC
ncbi:MAG: hypothetical protein CMM93_01585 [Rickettsiales bacterium]|nr:hypothetical protein [Rickettsiales bacterium]|tara:strand:+ start:1158 stop:1730 length:573 start_codon:yes stop_codon:yes gene_type:complete